VTTLDGSETLAELASRLGDPGDAAAQIARLAELGVLDLVDAPIRSKPESRIQTDKIAR
jgi:hypothetical protein